MDSPRLSIVTGASAGIGWHTAAALAAQGDRVVLVGRDAARTAAARDRIFAATPTAQIDVLLADFASLAAVDTLATTILERYPRIDVLVNNAGAFFSSRTLSQDGYEQTWAVNHLAPFWLTYRLLPRFRASAPARIVTVSSAAHAVGTPVFEEDSPQRRFSGLRAYAQSKLANVMFTYELAARLADSDVTANALHPGFVATDFGKNNTGLFMRVNGMLQNMFAIPPEAGAATSIFLASDPSVASVTGTYFSNKKPVASSRASYDVTARRALWQKSIAQCEQALASPAAH